MSLTVGEVFARRRLKKQESGFAEFFQPGQHKAVAVEDMAVLSWVDGSGQLIIAACHKVTGADDIEEWVLRKPAYVTLFRHDGYIEARKFATSYRLNEEQLAALEAATDKKSSKKKEAEE